jgi:hypothetical protein
MIEALASKTCTPCRGGELFHAQAPDWHLSEEAHRIERSFRFRNFREALTFVREIGELADCVRGIRTVFLVTVPSTGNQTLIFSVISIC